MNDTSSAAVTPVPPTVRPLSPPPQGERGSSRPRVRWRELCVYDYNSLLDCTIRHVYGYRMECSCGELGPVRRTVNACRADVRQHKASHVA